MDENKVADSVESKETVEEKEKTVPEEEVRISPRTGKPITRPCRRKQKPKGKRRGMSSPLIGMNGYNLQEGDNTKFMMVNVKLFNLPLIDMYDPEQVQQRISEFFEIYTEADMKPTVAGLAMALGYDRKTLAAIAHDYPTGGDGYKSSLPTPVKNLIKRTYNLMENLWESYMNSGKLNPVTGIFLGKNNYEYKDSTEHVVVPERKEEEYSAEEIRERYIGGSEPKRLSDSQSDSDE